MTEQTETGQYRWPDLSPVIRRFTVVDDQGRAGVALQDPTYHKGALFAHPAEIPAAIQSHGAKYLTDTAWHLQPDGSYSGTWYDYDGPIHVPPELIRRLTIVDDLGYYMPDRWADQLLQGLASNQPPNPEMTVTQAVEYAAEVGETVSERGLRLAAARGDVPGARRVGRAWLLTYEGVNHYLDNRPRPGKTR